MKKSLHLYVESLRRTLGVLCMLLTGIIAAWAEPIATVGTRTAEGVCSGTYFTDRSADYTLAPGNEWHFVFTNYNNSGNKTISNWNNWLLFARDLTKAEGQQDVFILRADNWENVAASNTECSSDIDFTNFNTSMNGATVDMTVKHSGSEVTVSAKIATADSKNWTYTYTKATNATLTLNLGVDDSYLDITTAALSGKTIVGNTDCSSPFGTWETSNQIINGDGALHYTFVNHNTGKAEAWNNFVFEAFDENNKYIDLRADDYGWGDLTTGVVYHNNMKNIVANLNGATVDMYVYKKGSHVLIEFTITAADGTTYKKQAYYPNVTSSQLNCRLGVDNAYIEISTREAAALPTNIDIADEIIGYLDNTSAYLEISGTQYQLDNDGNGYEVTFKNCNGLTTDTFKNWILRCFNSDGTINFNLRADGAALFTDGASWDEGIHDKYTFSLDNNFNLTDFPKQMNGADVDMKIWRQDSKVNVNAIVTPAEGTAPEGVTNYTYNFTMSGINRDDCFFALSQEAAVVDIKACDRITRYTTQYLDVNGNALKEAATSEFVKAGSAAAVTDADKEDITVGTVKYVFDQTNTNNILSIEALDPVQTNNILKVYFRPGGSCAYTIKNSLGDVITAGYSTKGSTVSYAYPRYINKEGTLYSAEKQTATPWYGKSFTLTQDNQVETVEYKETDIKDVVFFKETEDINGATAISTGDAEKFGSNQKAGFYEGTLINLPAGVYKVAATVIGTAGTKILFKAGDETVLEAATTGEAKDYSSAEFTLTQNADITVSGMVNGTEPQIADFIYITGHKSSSIVGATDCSSTYLSESSKTVKINEGRSYHYKFVNHSKAANNYDNWMLPVFHENENGKFDTIAIVRADAWDNKSNSNNGFASNIDWKNFPKEMNGATIDMTIAYSEEGTLEMMSTITTASGNSIWYYFTKEGLEYDNISTALSISNSWLDIKEEFYATTYTINYLDADGNALKDEFTSDYVKVGSAAEIIETDKDNISYNGQVYVFDSTNTKNKLSIASLNDDAAKNVMNVYFRKADTMIDNINATATSTRNNGKVVRNGKIVIFRNGAEYTIGGSRIR